MTTNASELAEFAYCRRAWWLGRVQGVRSQNLASLARGQTLHEAHGRRAHGVVRLRQLALIGLLVACLLAGSGLYFLFALGGSA